AMFTNSDNVRLIQMCDDCRVRAQFRMPDNPFAMGERPRPRTTEDELALREMAARAAAKTPGNGEDG
ncbi:MAG: hypothetical protein AAF074_21515, partial [Pseudomonadota bacterium]